MRARHPKQIGIEDMLVHLRRSGQIDKGMVALPERRNGLAEGRVKLVPKMREPVRSFVMRGVGITSGKPERIGESSLSDGVAAEEIDIIFLTLNRETLRAGRLHRRRQLTGAAIMFNESSSSCVRNAFPKGRRCYRMSSTIRT